MVKKRANGEGNIRKRADGRWEGRYTAGYHPETGKRIIKNVLGKTQAECKAKLKKAIEESQSLDIGRADEYTVAAWLRTWFELYTTIGNAVGRAKNTVMRYVDALAEKGLISTEPTSVLTRSGIKKNGNLRYTLRPIREAVELFHNRQMAAVERAAERQRVQRKLSAMDMLPGA